MRAHLVITRFNLELDFARGRDRLDPGWLAARLEPFVALCHPSMRRQDAEHRWLVLLDAATPPGFVDELRSLGGLEALALDSPHGLDGLRRAVRDALGPGFRGQLITTRLDSDDALADGHLAALQAAARPAPEPYFLNFPLGHIWHRRRLYACLDPASPFVSHVEQVGAGTPLTAYRVAHVWAQRVAPVRQLWGPSMWAQLIADHNEVSGLDGVRSPRRSPPRGLARHSAFAELDTSGRLAELARTLPRYVLRHRSRARYFRRNALMRSSKRPASRE